MILVSLIVQGSTANGQDYPVALSGQLLNQYDQPVAGATILITGPHRASTITDQNGQFLFIDNASQTHAHLQHWQQQGLMPVNGQATNLPYGQYKVFAQKHEYTQQYEVITEIGAWDGNWKGCGGSCNRNYLTIKICHQCDGPVNSQLPKKRQHIRETR